jgi:hypothetical protein
VDEDDPVSDFQLDGTCSRGADEGAADIDPGAGQPVIARPGAQHLTGPAGQVEHACTGWQLQRMPQRGQLFTAERIMDAVAALSDHEAPRKIIHIRQSLDAGCHCGQCEPSGSAVRSASRLTPARHRDIRR